MSIEGTGSLHNRGASQKPELPKEATSTEKSDKANEQSKILKAPAAATKAAPKMSKVARPLPQIPKGPPTQQVKHAAQSAAAAAAAPARTEEMRPSDDNFSAIRMAKKSGEAIPENLAPLEQSRFYKTWERVIDEADQRAGAESKEYEAIFKNIEKKVPLDSTPSSLSKSSNYREWSISRSSAKSALDPIRPSDQAYSFLREGSLIPQFPDEFPFNMIELHKSKGYMAWSEVRDRASSLAGTPARDKDFESIYQANKKDYAIDEDLFSLWNTDEYSQWLVLRQQAETVAQQAKITAEIEQRKK